MAGTLPGIPLSQQFSAIGQPLAGCLLYIYAANTTTPQDSFLDQGLTIKNPWPLAGDNSGRVPMFYLADGSVHVRLTDATGVVQFDYPSMMVVGPSSGGGGGGGSVDPTTIFQTGDVMWLDQDGTRAGWVRDNGKTIGNAVSGATERASADTQALSIFLWNTYSNAICPVIGGRGANGLADFTAGKQITLPDKRGFIPVGNTAMGNTDTGRLPVPILTGNSQAAGSWLGESTHILTTGELASHAHSAAIYDPTHVHSLDTGNTGNDATNFGVYKSNSRGTGGRSLTYTNEGQGVSVMTAVGTGVHVWDGTTLDVTYPNGGNGGHNNTPYVVIGSFFRKL